jgi:pimeloyl-ACP methyl ester carboxylesterase
VYWRDRNRLDWRPNLKAIDENLLAIYEGVNDAGTYGGPALFIRGGLSDYVPDSDLPGLKLKFPGAEVHTVVNASHWVHADAPGEFFTVVKGFLDR